MLNKPCFVTKSVVTILPHAMEVGLMLTVIAASESAVFIEPIQIKKKRYVSIYTILFKGIMFFIVLFTLLNIKERTCRYENNTNKTNLFH